MIDGTNKEAYVIDNNSRILEFCPHGSCQTYTLITFHFEMIQSIVAAVVLLLPTRVLGAANQECATYTEHGDCENVNSVHTCSWINDICTEFCTASSCNGQGTCSDTAAKAGERSGVLHAMMRARVYSRSRLPYLFGGLFAEFEHLRHNHSFECAVCMCVCN